MTKILDITDAKGAKDNIPDLKRWGDADTWKLIAKVSSESGRWMKSTKAMEVKGVGCMVQVTTQQGDNIAEAIEFMPFVTIVDVIEDGKLVGRRLDMISPEDFPYEE